MSVLSAVCFWFAGAMHVLFFVVESIFFQKADGYRYFKMQEQDHRPAKIWAFNQGFYNLFLAFGIFAGLLLPQSTLVVFCALSMFGAGLVLWFSAKHLRRGAIVQMLPAALGLLFHFLPLV